MCSRGPAVARLHTAASSFWHATTDSTASHSGGHGKLNSPPGLGARNFLLYPWIVRHSWADVTSSVPFIMPRIVPVRCSFNGIHILHSVAGRAFANVVRLVSHKFAQSFCPKRPTLRGLARVLGLHRDIPLVPNLELVFGNLVVQPASVVLEQATAGV